MAIPNTDTTTQTLADALFSTVRDSSANPEQKEIARKEIARAFAIGDINAAIEAAIRNLPQDQDRIRRAFIKSQEAARKEEISRIVRRRQRQEEAQKKLTEKQERASTTNRRTTPQAQTETQPLNQQQSYQAFKASQSPRRQSRLEQRENRFNRLGDELNELERRINALDPESYERKKLAEQAESKARELDSFRRQFSRDIQTMGFKAVRSLPQQQQNEPQPQKFTPKELPAFISQKQSRLKEIEKSLPDIEKQVDSLDPGNYQRTKLMQQAEQLAQEYDRTKRDIEFIQNNQKIRKNIENKKLVANSIINLRDNQYIIQILENEGVNPKKITPKMIEERRRKEFEKYQQLSRAVEIDRQRNEQLAAQVSADARTQAFQEARQKQSERLETSILDKMTAQVSQNPQEAMKESIGKLVDDKEWQKLIDRRTINKALRATDPLEILGIDRNQNITLEELRKAYKERMFAIFASDDPRAPQALRRVRDTYQFMDSVTQDDSSEEIRQKAKFSNMKARREKAQLAKEEFRRGDNQIEEGKKIKFAPKEFFTERKEDYRKQKQEQVGKLLAGIGEKIPGKSYAVKGWQGVKNIGAAADDRVARAITGLTPKEVKFKKYEKSRRFSWRLGGGYSEAQKESQQEIYKRQRKKGRSKGLASIGTLARMTIGRYINTIKNGIAVVRDAGYTYSGLKSLNNQRKILTSKISTSFWSSRAGKVAIAAQKGINGLKALGRSAAAGGRASLITGGVVLALGGGGPLAIAAIAGAGIAGATSKMISDTLSSTVPHSSDFIYENFQKRFGALGHKYGVGGLPGPVETGKPFVAGYKGRLRSLFGSFNAGMYGMGVGTLAAVLIPGVGPLVGAAAGLGLGASSKYLTDRVVNSMTMKYASSAWFKVLQGMPTFQLLNMANSIPWLSSQVHGIQKYGLSFLKNDWTRLLSLKTWMNYLNLSSFGLDFAATIKAINALDKISGVSMATRTASIGALFGTGAGILVASFLGVPLGTAALTGAFIGGSVGFFLGTAAGSAFGLPWLGVVTSGIFSGIGTFVGSMVDKLLGKVNALEQLLGSLSLVKGIFDFLNALDKRFDPTNAFGLALTLVMSGAVLADIGFDEAPSNQPNVIQQEAQQIPEGAQEPLKTSVIVAQGSLEKVKGISTPELIDCLEEKNLKITNPETSLVTKIRKYDGFYEIHTEKYIFTNIFKPKKGISKGNTLSIGEYIGSCQ